MKSNMRRPAGFTIIELLVVISIIVILVTMLLPVLGQARTVAMDLRCLAVERGLLQASNSYSTDEHQLTIHGDISPWYGQIGGPPWYQGTPYLYNSYCRLGSTYGQYPTICNVGQLTYNYYLPESNIALGCPQSDFREVIPAAYVYNTTNLSSPKNTGGYVDAFAQTNGVAAYRTAYLNQSAGAYRSTYTVRGPQMSMESLHKLPGWPKYVQVSGSYDTSPIIKPDQMAFFADHEQERVAYCTSVAWGTSPLPFWSRTHLSGFNVGYLDGHAALFEDRQRVLLFSDSADDPKDYGTQYCMAIMDRQ